MPTPSLNIGQQAQPTESQRVRVRVKETGQIGNIRADKFNPSVFDKLEDDNVSFKGDDQFEFKDILPIGGAVLGGILGGIPGAAIGAGAGSLVKSGLNKLEGDDVTKGGALKDAAVEAGLGLAGGAAFKVGAKVAKPALSLAKKGVSKGVPFLGELAFGPNVTRKTLPLVAKNPKLAKEMTRPGALSSLLKEGKSLATRAETKLSSEFEKLKVSALKARPKARVDVVPIKKQLIRVFDEEGAIRGNKIDYKSLPFSDAEIRGIRNAVSKIATKKGSLPGEAAIKLKQQVDHLYRKGPDADNYNRMLTKIRTLLKDSIDEAYRGTDMEKANALWHDRIDDIRFLEKNFLDDGGRRAESIIRKLTPKFRTQITPEDEVFLNDLLLRTEKFVGKNLKDRIEVYAATAVEREPIKGLVGQPFIGSAQLGARGMLKGARVFGRAREAVKGIDIKNAVRSKK